MNNKRLFISMTVLIAFTLIWTPMWSWLDKKYNWKTEADQRKAQTTPPPPAAAAPSTDQPATTPSATQAATAPTTNSVATSISPAAAAPQPAHGDHAVAVIGFPDYNRDGKKSEYPLGVKLTTRGAGVEAVDLNHYKREVSVDEPYVFQTPYIESSDYSVPLATRSVSINGAPGVSLAGVEWKVDAAATQPSSTPSGSVSFTTDIPDASGARIGLTKTYLIHPVKPGEPAPGYEMSVTYTYNNPTSQPVKVKTAYNGPTVPLAENNRDATNVVMGFDKDGSVDFKFQAVTSLKGAAKALDMKAKSAHPALWFGFSSNYFDAIVRPVDSQGNPLGFDNTNTQAFCLNPDAKDPAARNGVIALETPDIVVPANGSSTFTLLVFVGPKLRSVLNDPLYSRFPTGYDATLVMSGFWGFCTGEWMINSLVWLLNLMHYLFHDWGLAIIGLVILVRLLLHPVTKRAQISMSKMTKLGPEMQKLKEKYGDDKEGLQKAQIQLTKEQGLAPILGCLPMFLQMPIWIALYSSLQSTFEVRHAPFLGGYTWIKDLAQPDRLVTLKQPIDLYFTSLSALNVLPILMGLIFFAQQKFMPQPVATSPEQAQQQKMMKWMMPFMMPLFLYSSPSGLNLYILTSTAIGIVESKRVRDHIKQEEEKEKAGLVIVDVPPDKSGKGSMAKPAVPEKKGFLATMMERAQKMAEEAQKNAKAQQIQTGKKKKKK